MPRFLSERDARFFYNINNEFINDVVETEIQIFKVVIDESKPNDIYGESVEKRYYQGLRINCLINRSDNVANSDNFGINVNQDISFAISREMARQKNIYPQVGDIIQWNSYLYEAENIIENQRLAGRSGDDYNWSFVINAHLTNIAQTNLEERTL